MKNQSLKLGNQNVARSMFGTASLKIAFSFLAGVLCFSSCKHDTTALPEQVNTQQKQGDDATLGMTFQPNGVSVAAATAYTTATGSTTVGSIGTNENLLIGATSGTRTSVTYRTTGADKTGWVASTAVQSTAWMWPVECVNKTQDFDAYSSSRGGYHLAIDMTSAISLLEIRNPYAGVCKYKGYSTGNGNHVIMEHTNAAGVKIYSLFCHMVSASALVAGTTYARGWFIGTMGCTGSCTGTHCHFALYNTNYSSDPYGYTSSGGTLVSQNSSKIVMNYATHWDPEYVIRNNGVTP